MMKRSRRPSSQDRKAQHRAVLNALGLSLLLLALGVRGEASEAEPGGPGATAEAESGGDGAAEMARKLQNPLANIRAVMTDNAIGFDTGDDNGTSYGFQLQPVFAIDAPDSPGS